MSPRVAVPLLIVLIVGGLIIGALAGVAVAILLTIAGVILIVAAVIWLSRKASSTRRS
ncbi:MAG: hypothetical protein ACREIA_08750 [Opitutaceae bacterium]